MFKNIIQYNPSNKEIVYSVFNTDYINQNTIKENNKVSSFCSNSQVSIKNSELI
jgi:hypothetical protein